VQLQWSLVARGAEREVIPACRQFQCGTLIWSPLGRGFLSGKYKKNQPPPPGTRLETWQDSYKSFDNDRSWNLLDVLGRIAKRRETTHSAVAIGWLLAKPETTSVIVGARTVAQLDDNLRGAEVKLTPEDVKELDDASAPNWEYPYDFIGRQQAW
jgi:aryl-alcohol dehydrogenase-like predicted oxidoreductase